MKASIGRIVHYKTTKEDREIFMNQQVTGSGCNDQKILPAIVVSVHDEEGTLVNLKVIVDGELPTMWVTSVDRGIEEGNWDWPEKL